MCVSRHLWLPVFLSWKSVCVCVCVEWEREKEKEMCLPTGQRQTHARESRAVPSFSPRAVFPVSKSMSRLSLAVKPITLASRAITKPQLGWKLSAATSINSNAGWCWLTLVWENTNYEAALHKRKNLLPKGPGCLTTLWVDCTFRQREHMICIWRGFLAIWCKSTST